MEIIEEEQQFGSVGKTRHMKISRRDTAINDLKNSTIQGMLSLAFVTISFFMTLACIFISYKNAGSAGYLIGFLMVQALGFSILGVIVGFFGLRNRKKIRHYMEKRGIIIGFILITIYLLLFVRGIFIFLGF